MKSHVSSILDGIADPDKLAIDFSSADLISGSVKDKVLNTPSLSRYEKASNLLDDVLRTLKVFKEPQKLISFCDILSRQDNPALKHIAEQILQICRQY